MDIDVIEKEVGQVLEIEAKAPMWKLPSVMGRDFTLLAEQQELSGGERCAPYARYVGIDWKQQVSKGVLANLMDVFFKKWHFYSGMPVQSPVEVAAPMKNHFIKNSHYLQTMHRGPYHKVGDTYKALYQYSLDKGLQLADQSFEFYLNDPRLVKKEDLETKILIPIIY